MIRVFLADDHPAFRAGVRMLLDQQDDLTVIGEAAGGAEAIVEVERRTPDVLLLDMEMPDVDGLTVARTLAERGCTTRILPFSGYGDTSYVLGVLDAGASGYMMKDEPIETMVKAIRKVAAGGVFVTDHLAVEIVHAVRRESAEVKTERAKCEDLCRKGFTLRYLQILKLVAQGMSNADIAEQEFKSEHTVRHQVDQIKSMLKIVWRPALVAWCWRNGIVELDERLFEEVCGVGDAAFTAGD